MSATALDQTEPCFKICCGVCCVPKRYCITFMGCWAVVSGYLMRQCLSTTITQMVPQRNYTMEQLYQSHACPADDDLHEDANAADHDWNQQLQGIILSAFFVGYYVTHIPSGVLADKFGAKWILSLGILVSSIFTILIPLAIDIGEAIALIITRILIGFGQGTSFPALSVLVADWVPKKERGLLGSIIMGGGQLGMVISNLGSGYLLKYYIWSMVFYLWGSLGILWFFFFTMYCYSSPFRDPCIGVKEREYLLQQIGDGSARRRALPPTPFKAIFMNVPVWAAIICQIGFDWVLSITTVCLPKYMNDVLQVSIHKIGFYTALPFIGMWITSIIAGCIADVILEKNLMTRTCCRKVMTGISLFGPAIFIVVASYLECNIVGVTASFCISMAFAGIYYASAKLTPIEMSPNYAGILMAIINGMGAISGILVPIIVTWLAPNTTMQEWRLVFWVAFIVVVVTGIIYCIWASAEIQPFNEPKKE